MSVTETVSVPGIKQGEQVQRAGYSVLIPGECLKPGSRFWSDEQRAAGVWLSFVYLSSSEEEAAIGEAQRSGNLGALAYIQVRTAITGMHANSFTPVEQTGPDGATEVVQEPTKGAFSKVPPLERKAFWEELGPQGRSIAMAAFNLANNPSEGARLAAMQSFRVSG